VCQRENEKWEKQFLAKKSLQEWYSFYQKPPEEQESHLMEKYPAYDQKVERVDCLVAWLALGCKMNTIRPIICQYIDL